MLSSIIAIIIPSILAAYSRLDLRDRKQISKKNRRKKKEILVYSVCSVFSYGNYSI
jgi:hypothetical protein